MSPAGNACSGTSAGSAPYLKTASNRCSAAVASSAGKKELYDLSQDPDELHNLLPAAPVPVLETKLTEFMQAAVRGGKFQSPQVGGKTLENLKSLGYLQ